MTETQRKEIQRLRQAGMGYVKIAHSLGLSTNTVKSFCQRNPILELSPAQEKPNHVCPQCGSPIQSTEEHKSRRFCSDSCRAHYWTEHQKQITRQSAVTTICAVCGKSFEDYARKARKYCSHACYIVGRYQGGESHG